MANHQTPSQTGATGQSSDQATDSLAKPEPPKSPTPAPTTKHHTTPHFSWYKTGEQLLAEKHPAGMSASSPPNAPSSSTASPAPMPDAHHATTSGDERSNATKNERTYPLIRASPPLAGPPVNVSASQSTNTIAAMPLILTITDVLDVSRPSIKTRSSKFSPEADDTAVSLPNEPIQ